jgi:hypothetical protein
MICFLHMPLSILTLQLNHNSRSSKSKRREERKKARGKKGTIYEEEYLVGSLKRLYERGSAMQCKLNTRKEVDCVYVNVLIFHKTHSGDWWYDQSTSGVWTCG